MKSVLLKNGETLTYRTKGQGRQTLILLHGNMTSSQHFDTFMDALPEDIFTLALDLRGFGGSSYNQAVDGLKDFSEDLKLFVQALNIDSFDLLGWSTGGGIALQYAADYPENVNKLILVESVGIMGYPILKKDSTGAPILGEFLSTKEDVAADPVQVLPILNAYKKKDKATLRAIWDALIYTNKKPHDAQYDIYLEDMLTQRNLVDVDYALMTFNMSHYHNGLVEGSGDIDRVSAPTLIFQGENDLVVPPAMGLGIQEALKNKNTYIAHPYGHSPFVDDLSFVVKHVMQFLSK